MRDSGVRPVAWEGLSEKEASKLRLCGKIHLCKDVARLFPALGIDIHKGLEVRMNTEGDEAERYHGEMTGRSEAGQGETRRNAELRGTAFECVVGSSLRLEADLI